jgi:hypothetical protein
MTHTSQQTDAITDILAAWSRGVYGYDVQLKDIPAGQELLRASPEQQRSFLMAALDRLQQPQNHHGTFWMLFQLLSPLFRRALPLTHDDLLGIIRFVQQNDAGWYLEPHLARMLEAYLARNPRSPQLQAAMTGLVASLELCAWGADQRRRLIKLKELAGVAQADLALVAGDIWADAAIADLGAPGAEQRAAWAALFQQCAAASGSAPTAKWRKATRPLLDQIGDAPFRAALLRWLPLAERPRTTPIHESWGSERHPLLLHERNVDVLRGLIWLSAERGEREIARALAALAVSAYRKLPGVGPRSARLGNACIWALGQIGGQDGMTQLARIKTRVRLPAAQKQIASALRDAADRAGLTPDEVEELLVPTYGLEAVGLRRETLGEVKVELLVEGTSVALRYLRADGRRLASAPRALREQHSDELKDLTQAAADIKAMLPAQRDRIEQLYLQQRTWPLATWRERYLDHPLVGALARRLIWRFEHQGRSAAGIWQEGQLVGADGQPLDGLDEQTCVALWHPLDGATEEILGWRAWLSAREIQQPFKQAHREIYLLTEAERTTRVYSNRFAAHIVRQHQFNALCTARGWKNQLRLMVDDSYPPAQRFLPAWGLRAEYWVEGAGDTYGTDTNETGTYLYLATDQVRFYPLDAAQHYAHAGGGGYQRSWRSSGPEAEPLPLEQVPPLVLSEILRDVDLFVGVASVGNDPTWGDGGPEGRYRDYWSRYAFGDLSETAKTRREVLGRIVPRLKIAARCSLTERFLIVRGDIRTYKIHLGSGNILMEPNDQYLCIVPGRGAGTASGDGTRFLPFEGDGTLAIILSKALLLAEDTKIQDPTITRQLHL